MGINKSKNNGKGKSGATKRVPTSSNFQETRRIDTRKLSQATKTVPTNKKNNRNSKNKKMKFSKKHPKVAVTIRLAIVLLLILLVISAGIVVGMIYGMWGQDFEISEEELLIKGNSVVYDSEGNIKAELSGDENRKIIKLEDMAELLPKAYVAIEDERFYSHNGVDFKRTAGAIGTYILHRGSSSYGGSTITQQLVKNMTNEKAKTGKEGITRKVKEWAKAYQIERMLSKDQILELYLNVIFVGETNYGVQVASEYYFNKDAKDLSLEQCAFLAAINNAPNSYNPYSEKAPYGKDEKKTALINNRTKTVLRKMLELGYISQEDYDKECEKVDKGIKFKKGSQSTKVYSYHTDAVISKVINDLVEEKGWSKDYATTYVYGGGLKIYSTEQPEVQKKIEKQMADNASSYQIKSRVTKDSDGKYVKSQAAMVVIDNETGYVAGLVGGLGEKTESRGLNRAIQSTRSTGSSIKPIADLLPGLQEGLITAATRYLDYKTDFDNGKFSPKNDGGNYSGNISIRAATAMSHNVPFVKIMAEVTNPVARKYLKDMGITTLDDEKDTGLSLAIGGLTNGISPLEMAGAYATIANDGVYRTPLLYTKVEDDAGIVLEPKQETREVCSKQVAYILKDLLTSVIKGAQGKGGTAPYCAISGMDVAVKTGTTNANKDRWLCGLTNYYTAATWYGYDVEEEVKIGGNNPAGRIWAAVMKSLHTDKKNSRFKQPDGIVTASICSSTGLKATSKCSSTYTEKFVSGTVPEECTHKGYNSVEICEDTGMLATEYCPHVKTIASGFVLPKEQLKLWKTPQGKSDGDDIPTEICTEHNEETAKQNANAPKLKLVGKSTITLNVGESYVEQGATAKDDKDGDITNKIQISGSVNTSKAGTYTVTYKVKNSMDKESTLKRTIVVKDKTPVTPGSDENTTKPDKPSDENNTSGGNTNTNTTNTADT